MASQKKVILRPFVGPLLRGYLPATHFLDQSSVQLLDLTGRVQPVPLATIKSIAYVKDFNLDDSEEPERLGRRTYLSRPRGEGLLLRFEFSDRSKLEGTAPADLNLFESLVDDRCISITPPDPKSNTYRMLIPRSAIAAVQVLHLGPAGGKRKRDQTKANLQNELFEPRPD